MSHLLDLDWHKCLHILVSAPVIYCLVIFYVRLIGKRSTSQMNSFDWIVTVAMGSIVASTIILEGVTLLEGAFSILLLLLIQYVFTFSVRRFDFAQKLLKTTPQLLLFKGKFLTENMGRERILQAEVFSAIRRNGYKSTKDVYAVVLETNAELSVIPNDNNDTPGFSLSDVSGLPDGLREDLERRGEEEE